MDANKKSVGELITEARENVGITKNHLLCRSCYVVRVMLLIFRLASV